MSFTDIPIIQRSYKLYRELYLLEKNIPKTARYSLWLKLQNLLLEAIEALIGVGYLASDVRAKELIRIGAKIDTLKLFVRLANDVKIITQRQYITIQSGLDEIGRMLGGWLKSLKNSK